MVNHSFFGKLLVNIVATGHRYQVVNSGSSIYARVQRRGLAAPYSSAAGVRTISILEAIRDMGWDTHFCSPARIHLAPADIFNKHKIEIHKISSFCCAEVQDLVNELKPDVIVFDRYLIEEMVLWKIRKLCANTAIVIDTQDLHFVRDARQHMLEESDFVDGNCSYMSNSKKEYYEKAIQIWNSKHPDRKIVAGTGFSSAQFLDLNELPLNELFERYAELRERLFRELASINRADYALVTSKVEFNYLIRNFNFNSKKIFYAPFYYGELPNYSNREFCDRSGFFMLGHFRHPPNRDAIYYAKKFLWPRVKAVIPHAKVHIYGAHPEAKDFGMSDAKMDFKVVGLIKSGELHKRISKYRVCMAPLRYGAGLKGKVLDSWFAGTPVVATPIAAEGMTDEPFGGSIALTLENLVRDLVNCHVNEKYWNQCRQYGFDSIEKQFSKAANQSKLQSAFWRFVEEFSEMRDQNIVGSMLWTSRGYKEGVSSRCAKLKVDSNGGT